jgi:hypothetical protein
VRTRDLYMLTGMMLSLIVVIAFALGRPLLEQGGSTGFLLVAFGGGRPALTGLAVLLAKSAALAATGAVLMVAGAVARTLMRGEDGRA